MRKLILASLTISSGLAAQSPATRPRTAALRGSLEHRLAQLVDAPPFDRATWGIYVVDDRGRAVYGRNADHFSVPASNTKLVVSAAAARLPRGRLLGSVYPSTAWRAASPAGRVSTRPTRSPGPTTWGTSPSKTGPARWARTRRRPSATTSSGAAGGGASARRGRSRSARSP